MVIKPIVSLSAGLYSCYLFFGFDNLNIYCYQFIFYGYMPKN